MNPLFFNYGSDTTALASIAKPSGMIVTGRGNRYDPAFQNARDLGAIVYQYHNTLNCPEDLGNPQDAEQWLIDGEPPPHWPYKTAAGAWRTNWPGTYLVDIREGSPVLERLRNFCREMIERGHCDGFFLDTLGWRPWSSTHEEDGETVPGADFETWPPEEQELWTRCCVGVARIVHEVRAELFPDFELVHNNVWGYKPHQGTEGMRYANGCCLENSKYEDWSRKYVADPFAGAPFKKRVLVVSPTQAIADQWKADQYVTNITLVDKAKKQNYQKPTPAIVPYEDEYPCAERLDECERTVEALQVENTELKRQVEDLRGENTALESRLAQIHSLSAPE